MKPIFSKNITHGKYFLLLVAALLMNFILYAGITIAAPPPPTITSPVATSHIGGEYINFAGTCLDPDEGPLSGTALVWTSSKDGSLGTGQVLNTKSLQSGNHTITLTATNSVSESNFTTISITVSNNAPTSAILSPANGSSFNAGSTVIFSGVGTDIDTLDNLSYSWTSTTGGGSPVDIGTGETIAVPSLAAGTHVIILTVSDGIASTTSTPITIQITNNAPTATILSPNNNDTFYTNVMINFNAIGSDIEDTSDLLTYEWACTEHGFLSSNILFQSNTLPEGNHTITLTVTDTQGASNTTQQSVNIHVGNYDPVATITAPGEGTSYDMDDVIIFQGSAVDTEDGVLTGSSLAWSSSIDSNLGTGATITSSSLSSGTHIITLTATDDYSTPGIGSDSIIITVSNTFPTVTITNPSDNSSFYEGSEITFSGSASDAEDGPLTDASLAWTSSLDGHIDYGSPISVSSLSEGSHTITLTATDSEGAPTTSSPITVLIGNPAPVATITAPGDGTSYNRGDTITFRGTGTDTEDGNLTGSSLEWTSSITGLIGTGTILPIDTLVTGTHTITLTVRDSQSSTGNASIAITINNNAPVVTINSPPNNSIYEINDSISFTGTASDPEDGFISGASLVWTSSIDGPIGSINGTSVSSALSKGTHIVTLTATDSEGEIGSSSLTVHVGNNPPTVSITSPTSGSYDTGDYIAFQGTAADEEDGTLSGSALVWSSSIDGNFATGVSPAQINTLTTGQHEITLVATDSNGAVTYSTPISIRIGNTAPVATILNPSNNASFENGQTITFEGTGIDTEDGILLDTFLVWTSTRQGEIGTGTSFSTTALHSGQHTITLTATDIDGATHSTSIIVFAQNATPVVSISNPATGSSFDEGNNITFQGTATDTEDGTLSGNALVWTSNYDGQIGTGTTFETDTLSSGTHVITLTASDTLGSISSTTITVTIVPMTLSASTLSLNKGETGTISISGGKSPYRAATRRSQIALPDENNGSVLIKGISAGSTIITITDNKKNSAEVNVTVTDAVSAGGIYMPDADAGSDQSGIDENDKVYLTGSNANIQSTEPVSFLWVQTDPVNPTVALAEPTVELSDATSGSPWFIAPLVDLNGQALTFQLTVTNQTGADTDTIRITLNNNGITEFPNSTATFQSTTGENMATKTVGSGVLKRLNTVEPSELNTSTLPQNIIYGLIDMKVKAPAAGATISLVVYFPEAAPLDYKWFKYIESEDIWLDFDRDLISSGTGDGAVFSQDRKSVTLYITDDGRYDDNKEDLIIEDPSGLGKLPIGAVSNSASSGDGDDSNGCFIKTANYKPIF